MQFTNPIPKVRKKRAENLVKDGRVNFFTPADYSYQSDIDITIKAIFTKIASDSELIRLGKQD